VSSTHHPHFLRRSGNLYLQYPLTSETLHPSTIRISCVTQATFTFNIQHPRLSTHPHPHFLPSLRQPLPSISIDIRDSPPIYHPHFLHHSGWRLAHLTLMKHKPRLHITRTHRGGHAEHYQVMSKQKGHKKRGFAKWRAMERGVLTLDRQRYVLYRSQYLDSHEFQLITSIFDVFITNDPSHTIPMRVRGLICSCSSQKGQKLAATDRYTIFGPSPSCTPNLTHFGMSP
jgi:hypothetical protein